MLTLTQSYSYGLVSLSYLIAFAASYSAFAISGRVAITKGIESISWLIGGACAMGLGIWSMHFIALLALHLAIPVSYYFPTVALSVIFAIMSSAVALLVVSNRVLSWPKLISGAFIMGSGIASMHYTGMASMQMDAYLSYDPFWFAISVLLAILMSFAAMVLTYRLRYSTNQSSKIIVGLLMGVAIAGMHYTGMFGTTFYADHLSQMNVNMYVDTKIMAYSIGLVALILLGITFIISFLDRN